VLHELGCSALLVDFYGSGASTGSGTTIGVREADDVGATLAYARQAWPGRKIVLYGISMGGAAILRAVATQKLRADGIIIEAVFESLSNTGKNRFRAMGLPASPFGELLLFWGSVQEGFNFFTHNPIDYARAVKVPTLVLNGEQDERVTPVEARRLAEAIGGHARLIVYRGVPHMAIVDAFPYAWKNDVREFMSRL